MSVSPAGLPAHSRSAAAPVGDGGQALRYGVLGPLRVEGSTGDMVVSAGRDRTVLAMLLLFAGRPVTVGQLMDALWEDDPPPTARGQIQTCVSRLRKSLAAAGMPGALVTHPIGYLLRTEPGELDAAEFDRLVGEARAAVRRDDPRTARDLYRAALALWRGPALAGIDSRAIRHAADALDDRRSAAIEDRIDVELRLGQQRDLIGELAELVERHPLRERLRGQLMLALCQAGRRADALSAYRQGRRVLADELGIEPGPALRDLHRRILVGDPTLMARDSRASAQRARCLPRPVEDFTGRAESVAYLLAGARATTAGPVVQLVDGMPGSGKTALAVHVAHLLTADYPDAQLFIDLYGHGERAPLEPAAALVTLLRQLGVPSERIPAEVEDRVALWRTELSSRRVLVVLDNAAGSAQVAPLLPTTRGTMALVTSRRRLVGLDGVRPRSLPVLSLAEAVELLGRVAGADRVAAEPDAAVDVVQRCGYLPLAIRLAGARLAHRPSWRVADLAGRLAGERPLLPELSAEDRTVAGAFALSYAPLPEAQRRVFRLLGLYPGEWLDDRAVAALADVPLAAAQDALGELVNRHLVEEPDAGRYRLHDLMREYAATLAEADSEGVAAPLERLLDYYLHAAVLAGGELESATTLSDIRLGERERPDLLAGFVAGIAWLEEQRGNIRALVDTATSRGYARYAWQLARACARFFHTHGYIDDLLCTHIRALASAEADGDTIGLAVLNNYIASAYFYSGRYRDSARFVKEALALYESSGLVEKAASTRGNLAVVYGYLGQPRDGLQECELALAAARRTGSSQCVAHVLQCKAINLQLLGRLGEALWCHRQHLFIRRQSRDLASLARSMGNLGAIRARMGHHDVAERLLTVALGLKRRTGNRYGEAETLNDLASVYRAQGRVERAVPLHREALSGVRRLGDRHSECAVLNDLALTLRAAGQPERAADLHRQALGLAERHGYAVRQADAHDGLGHCLATRDPGAARWHWERALEIYRGMDLPQRLDVREQLRCLAEETVTAGGPPRQRAAGTTAAPRSVG